MDANIEISTKTVGFTSVAKVAFIHQSDSGCDLNYIDTEFPATSGAVSLLQRNEGSIKIAVCDFNGEIVAMTAEESRASKSPEIGLKLINYTDTQKSDGVKRAGGQWVRDEGYMSAGGYKNAMETLKFDARKNAGKPLSEWLELIEISESTHKKYTSGHATISRVVAKLINALLREKKH